MTTNITITARFMVWHNRRN